MWPYVNLICMHRSVNSVQIGLSGNKHRPMHQCRTSRPESCLMPVDFMNVNVGFLFNSPWQSSEYVHAQGHIEFESTKFMPSFVPSLVVRLVTYYTILYKHILYYTLPYLYYTILHDTIPYYTVLDQAIPYHME